MDAEKSLLCHCTADHIVFVLYAVYDVRDVCYELHNYHKCKPIGCIAWLNMLSAVDQE